MHEPGTEEHQDRVEGDEHQRGARERINLAEVVALVPAFVVNVVCTAVISDVLHVLRGGVGVGTVVQGPVICVLVVHVGQHVVVVTWAIVHIGDGFLVAPPGAQDDSNDAGEGDVDGRGDSMAALLARRLVGHERL